MSDETRVVSLDTLAEMIAENYELHGKIEAFRRALAESEAKLEAHLLEVNRLEAENAKLEAAWLAAETVIG